MEGQLVGTLEISLRRLPNPFYRGWQPYISNLAVLRTWRQMGIGKSLLLGAEGVVKTWGYHVLHLHVMEHNLPARHLYTRLQYRLLISQYDPFWLFGLGQRLLLYKPLSLAERNHHDYHSPS
jgi:ribosomal protein S18 acetylase RimI-like enzyme